MKLNFRKIGEGPAVIILHGLFGSSDNWQTFGKQLAAKGFSVYMVDLRNHGLSPHEDSFNYQVMSDDIHELFEAEQLQDGMLMGHSLGGKTAMTFAFAHPSLTKGLIVVDIAPRQYPVHNQHVLDALLSIDLNEINSRKEVEESLSRQLNDTGTIQFLQKNLYWQEKDQLGWRFNLPAIRNQFHIVGTATIPDAPFPKPTLFIKGEKSDYITYDDERQIFELFSDVEIKTAPSSGHWVHADNPAWLLETVSEFLLKVQ